MHPGGGAARLAEEREVRRPHRVGGGHEGADQRDPHEHRVAVVPDIVDDLVLGEEPGEREHPGEGERRHDPGPRGHWHLAPQSAHVLLHVEAVMRAGVTHRAGAQEQTALEEGVGEDVEHRWQPGAGAETEHHVAELADRRVGEDLLDVVLHERQQRRDDDRDRGDDDDEVDARRRGSRSPPRTPGRGGRRGTRRRRPSSRSAAATTPVSARPSRRATRCAAGTGRSCRCTR